MVPCDLSWACMCTCIDSAFTILQIHSAGYTSAGGVLPHGSSTLQGSHLLSLVAVSPSLLSVYTSQALLSASLPHSLSDLYYSSYDWQEGACLIPGMDLFADPWRCSIDTLLTSLQWAGEELVRRSHVLKV